MATQKPPVIEYLWDVQGRTLTVLVEEGQFFFNNIFDEEITLVFHRQTSEIFKAIFEAKIPPKKSGTVEFPNWECVLEKGKYLFVSIKLPNGARYSPYGYCIY